MDFSTFLQTMMEEAKRTSVAIPATSKDASARAVEIIRDQENKADPMFMANRMVRCTECTDEPGEDDPKNFSEAAVKNLYQFMPILTWLPQLRKSSVKDILTSDVIAGLTVGVVAIPQGMSYANIAGLEYHYGLYSACICPIVYVLFGQSRQLAVGPVAIVSLLVEAGINGLLTEEECPAFFNNNPKELGQNELCPDEYARLVFLCTFLVAVIQLVGRVCKMGFLVSFLAHPVISGFTTGAAMIIMLSQAKYIVGFDIPKSQYVYKTVAHIITNIGDTKALNCAMGLFCFFTLVGCKVLSKKYKKVWWLKSTSPLFISVAGILLLSNMQSLKEDHYVKNVGFVPKGMPPISINYQFDAIGRVMPTAITVALIGYMESIAISKALASAHKYDINAGQEMLALGITNLVGSMLSCYPCSGSFCRSSVNNGMGAKTGFSSIINSLVLFLTLILLAPIFFWLPKFVLGAIVMNAVTGLIETGLKDSRSLYAIRKWDAALWAFAFVGTLFLGVLPGIGIAVAVSLCKVIHETVRPQFTVLWRLPGTSIYRSVKQESGGVFIPGVFIVRLGCSLYFANSSFVKETLFAYVNNLSKADPIKYVIIEMTSVTSVDSTAAHLLEEVVKDFKSRGVQVVFCMVNTKVEKIMRLGHVVHALGGEEWVLSTVHVAVQACLKHQHENSRSKAIEAGEDIEKGDAADNITEATTVVVGDEVNVSNDIHNTYTTIYISTQQSNPRMLSDLTNLFMKQEVAVVRAEVDVTSTDATTMCFWVTNMQVAGKEQKKVQGEKLQLLRDDVQRWLEAVSSTPETTETSDQPQTNITSLFRMVTPDGSATKNQQVTQEANDDACVASAKKLPRELVII